MPEDKSPTSSAIGRLGAANGRAALEAKFLAQADGDPQRAESFRKAYYARLALKSVQARRARGGAA